MKTFEFGQVYVAMSRVRHLEDLYINCIDKQNIKADQQVIEFYNKHQLL
jgi:ATP-dependent exoDNAse (exonuclease V) alpha subunit